MSRPIYVVFEENWNAIPYCIDIPVRYFEKEADAQAAAADLNKKNIDPIKEDDYGPMMGIRYVIIKKELE